MLEYRGVKKPPPDILSSMQEKLIEQEKMVQARGNEFENELKRLVEEEKEEINSVIGPEKLGRYLAYRQQHSKRIAEFESKYGSSPDEELRENFHRQMASSAQTFMKDMGINTNQIRNIYKDYRERVQSLYDKINNENKLFVESSEKYTPYDTEWTIKRPPYDGDRGYTERSYKTKGKANISFYNRKRSGNFGIYTYTEINDASDSETSDLVGVSEIDILYQMPTNGYVTIDAELKGIRNRQDVYLSDEWGVSDSKVHLFAEFYIRPFRPDTGKEVTDHPRIFYFDIGDYDGNWKLEFLKDYHKSFSTTIDRLYTTGEWVGIGIGIRNGNSTWVNDKSSHSLLSTLWKLEYVGIKVST